MESPYINASFGDANAEAVTPSSASSEMGTAAAGGDGTRLVNTLLILVVVVCVIRYWRIDKIVRSLLSLLDLLFSVKRRARQVQTKTPEWNMADMFEEVCSKHSNREFCIMAQTSPASLSSLPKGDLPTSSTSNGMLKMTFGQAEKASSAVAIWATSCRKSTGHKYEPGDIVALFMPSSCEFVVALFGLMRVGIQAALVNTELRGLSLVHALTVALEGNEGGGKQVKAILVSPDLKPVLDSLMEAGQLPTHIRIVACGIGCELDPWIENRPFAWMGTLQGRVRWDDTCVYIYTSGTTGLPKASKVNHLRMWTAGCVTNKVNQLRASDRMYCPLPLYHASGCTLGLGACLQRGCTMVIRSKFSVRHFSNDVKEYDCTCMQYIGEMARYLVAAPPNKYDGAQRLRFAYGNGMPKEVWKAFQTRYNIEQINEFYASTEGNVNIFNNTGVGQGACGIVPRGLEWIYPIGLFQHDDETGELLRDKQTGLCIQTPRGQTGELLGLIQQHDPSRRFDGYTDGKATRSKVVKNVCKPGDAYFRSGDLLRQDFWGFLYFCDRIGDSFRWKGENVSTSEVSRIILLACHESSRGGDQDGVERFLFAEAVVYGVEVPGCPGRAGMATVVMNTKALKNDQIEPYEPYWTIALWNSLQLELPRYAQPLFLRVTKEIQKTSTQKYLKKKLQDESFQSCGSDPVYLRDDAARSYVLMHDATMRDVMSGKRRV